LTPRHHHRIPVPRRTCDQTGQPATLVTYLDDPRDDLAILSSPAAIIIDGIRVR
jgi:hypothetical protein